MSELIIQPGDPTGIVDDFGLSVISQQPVLLRVPPTTSPGTLEIVGSAGSDVVQPLSPLLPSALTVSGGDGDDTIVGGASNDLIEGEGGRDNLAGGAGDDTIVGGDDRDTLTGNEGEDDFVFQRRSTGGRSAAGRRKRDADRVEDFSSQDDTILLDSRLLRGANLPAGKLKRKNFAAVDRITPDVQKEIVYEKNTGFVIYNQPNGQDIFLMKLDKNLNIKAADFEIF